MDFKISSPDLLSTPQPLLSSRSSQMGSLSRTPTRERHLVLQAASRTHTPVTCKGQEQDSRTMSPLSFETSCALNNSRRRRREEDRDKENVQGDNLRTGRRCLNHAGKVGTYEAKDSQTETYVYCEKCAILLASQGFKVSKLAKPLQDRHERTQLRKAEITTIYELTQECLRLLTAKKHELHALATQSAAFTQDSLAASDLYFGSLLGVVQQLRESHRTYILDELSQSNAVTAQLQAVLDSEIQEVTKMAEDLEGDHSRVSEEVYSPVVEFYKIKMKSYRNGMKGWGHADILPRALRLPELEEVATLLLETVNRGAEGTERSTLASTPRTGNGRKIKGKSVHFSFETEKKLTESVIPEENMDSSEENLLEEYLK